MDFPARALTGLAQGFQKTNSICIVLENVLPPVAPTHHMIGRSLKFDADFAGHRFGLLAAHPQMQEKRTDPFFLSQFASAAYRHVLAQHGLLASMARKGNCYDNAFIESFWSSLKYELVTIIASAPWPKLATPSLTTSKSSITAPDCTLVLPTKARSNLNPN
jgi:hypothetical protein